jgi:hypothetical protein
VYLTQEVTHWMPLPAGPVIKPLSSLKKKLREQKQMSKFDREFLY